MDSDPVGNWRDSGTSAAAAYLIQDLLQETEFTRNYAFGNMNM